MRLNEQQLDSLENKGFTLVEFHDKAPLDEMLGLAKKEFPKELGGKIDQWHSLKAPQEEHLQILKKISTQIIERDLVSKILKANIEPFTQVMGENIDTNVDPYVRLSRPAKEEDFIGLHRDTFYGTSPWELNIWFPLVELHEGCGLMILPGSHRVPSKNVRDVAEENEFKRGVTKGSLAHQVGYTYQPKTDDLLAALNPKDVALIRPPVGSAIFFFGCGAHRAYNNSAFTRLTIDARLKPMHAPTNTRPGYYKPLHRGLVARCTSLFDGETQGR